MNYIQARVQFSITTFKERYVFPQLLLFIYLTSEQKVHK